MAEHYKGLVDAHGRPIEKQVLTEEIAAPTLGGVRSVISGYPGDGLTPTRLASIMRDADQGEPLRFFELAEQIEERDLHYSGVLGTRKRSVAQIGISVEPASEDKADVEKAEMISAWLKRDELQEELFDILDSVGKGISMTEIIWDSSEGDWTPARLEWRDPRWFRFDRVNGRTPTLITQGGDKPLQGFKFITAEIRAKSGLPVRSGLGRLAAWAWMFKAYTLRDWAIFTATYGQPVRVGKYGAGATEDDKETLFRAVANIAGDCAAIIPDTMMIEFIEGKDVKGGGDLYEKRADWWDRQVSKGVLGQTATTDAEVGGLGSGKEHRQVQEDIERADASALAAILNRDLIRPWIDLQYGPQKEYPRLKIERPEHEDLELMSRVIEKLAPLGLRVSAREVREKFNLSDPEDGEEVLGVLPPPAGSAAGDDNDSEADAETGTPSLQSETGRTNTTAEEIAARLMRDAQGGVVSWLEKIDDMVNAAGDLDELREMLRAAFPDLNTDDLADPLAAGMEAAHAAGRYDIETAADQSDENP